MKIKTRKKAGGFSTNHNQPKAMPVKTAIKSGGFTTNHNPTKALPVKTAVRLAADITGQARNALYEQALRLRENPDDSPTD